MRHGTSQRWRGLLAARWATLERVRLRRGTGRRIRRGAIRGTRSRPGPVRLPAAVTVAAGVALVAAACEPLHPEVESAGPLLVAVALRDGGNDVVRLEPGGGASTLLTTDPAMSATGFTLSPDGSRLAYRLAHPLRAQREELVVASLAPDGSPRRVLATSPGQPRMAGHAWAGAELVVGLQGGLGVDEGGEVSWRIARAAPGLPTALELTPPPDSVHLLVGWDEEARVAALLRLGPAGGPADGLLLARGAGAVTELPLSPASGGWAASPDGRLLAVMGGPSGSLEVVRLASAERRAVPVGAPYGLLWSADSSYLAWHEPGAVDGGAVLHVEHVPTGRRARAVLPSGARALAVEPGGGRALVTAAGRLSILQIATSAPSTVNWSPPGEPWWAAWPAAYNARFAGQ
jgi:hypothetical protein